MTLSKRQFLKTAAWLTAAPLLPARGQIVMQSFMADLGAQIQTAVENMRQTGQISADERTAWHIIDILTGKTYAGINENRPMQSASMVKPMVIQAYLYCHYLKNASNYPLNSRIIEEMRGMIVDSDNRYTNNFFERLGGPASVQAVLRKNAPNIFRDISIVENIPSGGKTYRNKASAADYSRFSYALWHEQMPGARLLKELMGIKNHDRISVNTQYIPDSLMVYDKTGSTSRLCGNFGIIAYRNRYGQLRPYCFTGIIEKSQSAQNYTRWITDRSARMREISDITYLYIDQHVHA